MITARQAWDWLRRELDRWCESGQNADFWWRDDDAVAAGAELERLLRLSERHSVAVALAVIPARLDAGLDGYLESWPRASVLQHGYDHVSHAEPGARKLELGGERAVAGIAADLRSGFGLLQQHFGSRFTPVLVPPWNRIDEGVLAQLPGIGFGGISTMRVRRRVHPAAGLLQVNAHLDPVNWRQRRGFIGHYPAIAILVQHLAARRSGYRDIAEPTGILTHHLAQNEAVWRFLDELLALLCEHPAVRWTDAPSIWANSPRQQQRG